MLPPAEEPLVFADVPFDHPLWILWSSGTTGVPKGIVQGHGGIVVELLEALGLGAGLRPEDRYLFLTSTSWMVWNFLVGGLPHGSEGSVTHFELLADFADFAARTARKGTGRDAQGEPAGVSVSGPLRSPR
ncbi:AMP-binding protein [Streptomyces pristinaespiralis]|uniref:AMP-binding protein n=1 Tax=Streptomyces pristinaespiralis TaxID=38300 RepID=UPI0037B37A3E